MLMIAAANVRDARNLIAEWIEYEAGRMNVSPLISPVDALRSIAAQLRAIPCIDPENPNDVQF